MEGMRFFHFWTSLFCLFYIVYGRKEFFFSFLDKSILFVLHSIWKERDFFHFWTSPLCLYYIASQYMTFDDAAALYKSTIFSFDDS